MYFRQNILHLNKLFVSLYLNLSFLLYLYFNIGHSGFKISIRINNQVLTYSYF